MTSSPLSGFRAKVFRAISFFAPKGSALDTIFDSYDDWREFRRKTLEPDAIEPAPDSLPPNQT